MRVDCSRSRFDARLQGRWVVSFAWVSGVFRGTVESYTVLDAEASYALGRSWIVGAQITNLFDDEHYETFGGNLLGQRALVYLTYLWQ